MVNFDSSGQGVFSSHPSYLQSELAALCREYGEPVARMVDLDIGRYWAPRFRGLGDAPDPAALRAALARPGRVAEVCLVVRRPNGRLLTSTKTFYPMGVFRLMTGGVEPGETVLDALRRETLEETGLRTKVRRFLAALSYRTAVTLAAGITEPIFHTYAFLLDETAGTLGALDEGEQISAYGEVEPAELLRVADELDALARASAADLAAHRDAHGGIESADPREWWDWGRFRATIHRAVHEALTAAHR